MAEAVISTVIVATMLVAALHTVGLAVTSRYKMLWRMQGHQLARALMAEIRPMPYQDPDLPTLVLACEAGEASTNRSTFDDVDDFNGYQQTPPQARDGSALTSESTWSWNVTVEWVNPLSPGGTAVPAETKAKRITVTVIRDQVSVATLVTLRTNVD